MKRMVGVAEQASDHLGGIIHHGNDASIFDPCRTNDPDGTHDLLAAV